MPSRLPAHRSPGTQHQPGQGSNATSFCHGSRARWLGQGGGPSSRETRAWSLCVAGSWCDRDRDRDGGGTLRHVADRQVATLAGSSSASPAQPPGTSYPRPGGKAGFAEPQGCGCTPSPGRAPMGAPGQGSARGTQSPGKCSSQPGVLSRQQPTDGWLSAGAGWQPPPAAPGPWGTVMGYLLVDREQGGEGTAILGSPRQPSCHALCSTDPVLGQGPGCRPEQR